MLVRLCTCGSVSGRFVVGVGVWCREVEWSSVGRVSCVGRNMESQRRECPKAGSAYRCGFGRRGGVCVYRDME